MKIKVNYFRQNEQRAGEVTNKEFHSENTSFEKIVKCIAENECLLYLEESGELGVLRSAQEFASLLSRLENSGQNTLVLLVERAENYYSYMNIDSFYGSNLIDSHVLVDEMPNLYFSIIQHPKEQGMTLKKHKPYMLEWVVKNLSDFPMKKLSCSCDDPNIEVIRLITQSIGDDFEKICVQFKCREGSKSSVYKSDILFKLYDEPDSWKQVNEMSLKFSAAFEPYPEFYEIRSMGLEVNDLVFQLLDKYDNNLDRVINELLENS